MSKGWTYTKFANEPLYNLELDDSVLSSHKNLAKDSEKEDAKVVLEFVGVIKIPATR